MLELKLKAMGAMSFWSPGLLDNLLIFLKQAM